MSTYDNATTNETLTEWQNVHTFWLDGVVTLILVVVGVTGNISLVISLVCMAKRWLPLYYYFLTFSLWNTALLGSTVFFYCLPALDERIGARSGQFTYLNLLGYLLANSGMTAAIWLVLGVTVERCIVVTRPLDQIVSEPRKRAKIVTSAISILAPIYNLPLFFELRVVKNGTDLAKSAMRESAIYKIGYRIVSNMLFLSVVPFLSIIVMSIRIIYVVQNAMASSHVRNSSGRKRRRKSSVVRRAELIGKTSVGRESLISSSDATADSPLSRCHSSSQKNAYATHMTLAVLATKFVLCYTLPTVLNILEIIVEPSTLQQEGLGFLVDVSNLMVVADSAFNAFAYMSWRRKIQMQQMGSNRKRRQTSKPSITNARAARSSSRSSRNSRNSSIIRRNGYCRSGLHPMNNKSDYLCTASNKSPECPLIDDNVDENTL